MLSLGYHHKHDEMEQKPRIPKQAGLMRDFDANASKASTPAKHEKNGP